MRIIAGKHRSRILKTLEGNNTRPMMDRMKESVFNTIGPYFDGGISLDLFGGSGALSLEGLSRGIEKAYITEIAKDALKVIKDNVAALHEEDNIVVMNLDYKIALKRLEGLKFDLVYLDPPYRMNINNELLDYLLEHEMLNKGAYIVCHYVTGNMKMDDRLKCIKNYSHDEHELTIYEY